ncbi:MAG TPA: ribosome maturation factor RimM [Terriglobales bacterium]|nr:ribosome maturation factor RimM [Terriglobales bacterium]
MSSNGEFITIARVVKTQGRHGEVGVDLLTDFPERFEPGARVFTAKENGERRELHIEDVWPHKGMLILKFAGVDTMNDAQTLLKSEIQVPFSERKQLEEGTWYVSDLIGCTVTDSGREIGNVADVEFGAGEAPLLIVREGNREHMIPLTEAFTIRIDIGNKKIELQLPEGMLEINAPVTTEEKKQQEKN